LDLAFVRRINLPTVRQNKFYTIHI
jgi:hypothetical protein